MKKFLIFRTDRIGDFIASKIIFESIKSNNNKNVIDVVCSKYNKKYLEYYKYINKLIILDRQSIKNYISSILQLRNVEYDYLIILDGKRRSFIFSLFIKSIDKYIVVKNKKLKLFTKFFSYKDFLNSEKNSQFKNFVNFLNIIKIKPVIKFNYYKDYIIKSNKFLKYKNYLHLHLDEKWFEGYYHEDYDYMNLNSYNLNLFLLYLKKKFNKKIIITSGFKKINNLEYFVKNYFFKFKNSFIHKTLKSKIIFIHNLDFRDIEIIVKNSNMLITCEGSVSHVSNSFNIPTLCLIQRSRKKTAMFWTSHMKKINYLYRSDIKQVIDQINKIKF